MAEITLDSVTTTVADTVRDAFYVGVGASVIAVQKLQVQRHELTKQVTKQVDEAKGSFTSVSDLVDDRVKLLEERIDSLEGRLETILSQLETKLPEQARELVKSARDLVNRAA